MELVQGEDMPRAALRNLYAAADAFVLPTRGEGWGLPIAEAMAMALPVIATNWSGPTALLSTDNSYPLSRELTPLPGGQAEACPPAPRPPSPSRAPARPAPRARPPRAARPHGCPHCCLLGAAQHTATHSPPLRHTQAGPMRTWAAS